MEISVNLDEKPHERRMKGMSDQIDEKSDAMEMPDKGLTEDTVCPDASSPIPHGDADEWVSFVGAGMFIRESTAVKGKEQQIRFYKNGRFTIISVDAIEAVDSQKGILAGGEWFELPFDTVEAHRHLFVKIVWNVFGTFAANEASETLLKEKLRLPKE